MKILLFITFFAFLTNCTPKISNDTKVLQKSASQQENFLESFVNKIQLEVNSIESATTKLAVSTSGIYANLENKNNSYKPKQKYVTNKDGTYWATPTTDIKSELWVSGFVSIDARLKKLAQYSELIDPALIEALQGNAFVVQSYYNSKESLNRIFPGVNAPTQYEAKMSIPTFNFYYEADEKNNPAKETIWVKDAYVDPAGRGWMISCISPVYYNSKLEGVVGLDVTIDNFLKKFNLEDNASIFIVQKNGQLIAASQSIGKKLNLPAFEKHNYQEAIKSNTLKTENFDLSKNQNLEVRQVFEKIKNEKNIQFESIIDGIKVKVSSIEVPKLNWLVVEIK